jgi:hypothetical protein
MLAGKQTVSEASSHNCAPKAKPPIAQVQANPAEGNAVQQVKLLMLLKTGCLSSQPQHPWSQISHHSLGVSLPITHPTAMPQHLLQEQIALSARVDEEC